MFTIRSFKNGQHARNGEKKTPTTPQSNASPGTATSDDGSGSRSPAAVHGRINNYAPTVTPLASKSSGRASAPNGASNKVETVLGPGVHYKGVLKGSAGVRIEGSVDGAIVINGPVVIAEGAKVNADIQATVVLVAGSIKGNITAARVEILATGRIWGDLVTKDFASEEGAYLRGQVKMQDHIPLPVMPSATAPLLRPSLP